MHPPSTLAPLAPRISTPSERGAARTNSNAMWPDRGGEGAPYCRCPNRTGANPRQPWQRVGISGVWKVCRVPLALGIRQPPFEIVKIVVVRRKRGKGGGGQLLDDWERTIEGPARMEENKRLVQSLASKVVDLEGENARLKREVSLLAE